MIAPPSDIRGAIRAYYQKGDELVPTSLPPPELLMPRPPRASVEPVAETASADSPMPVIPLMASDTAARAAKDPEKAGIGLQSVNASAASEQPAGAQPSAPTITETALTDATEPISESSQHVPARERSMPIPKRGTAHRRVTLTLLDGTKVTLPARPSKQEGNAGPTDGDMPLTARDIVQALRAKMHGQNASEVLGEHDRWEGLFVALLSVLLKKHLIADWEFIDELKRL